jgi:hypothetical protein
MSATFRPQHRAVGELWANLLTHAQDARYHVSMVVALAEDASQMRSVARDGYGSTHAQQITSALPSKEDLSEACESRRDGPQAASRAAKNIDGIALLQTNVLTAPGESVQSPNA